MQVRQLHSWQVTIPEALEIQRRLAAQVSRRSAVPATVQYVAGVDLSPPDSQGIVRGAVVLVSFPDLTPVEVQVAEGRPSFPYVPGLLSFRESPVLLQALERLRREPDIILVDGHGIAHPRRFGIACHIGVLVDRPTIGCAKSRLVGREGPLASEAGACADLTDKGELVGVIVRTREGAAPIYVTIGHKVDLPTAVRWALACCKGYRIPEPTRLAHLAAAGRLQARPGSAERRASPGRGHQHTSRTTEATLDPCKN